MIASEPLPHFVDDLLGYLHETHPTHATLDGVHTHDDLLEDVSRQAIDTETHALAGYLRGRSCELRSSFNQRVRCLRSNVADHHGIAGLLNIPGNGPAYGSQTNKAYHFHFRTSWRRT